MAGDAGQTAVHWFVSGRVQGVGFRWFVQQAARHHGVPGDVRNLPDGRVEIRARAGSERIGSLLAEVQQGPPGARVDGVEHRAADPSWAFDGFEVRS